MALSPERIQQILQHVISCFKKYEQDKQKDKSNPNVMPEYYPFYKEMVMQMDDIKAHAIINHFPEKLFRNAAPNQSEKELQYMRSIYKQETLPVFLDFVNTLQRPLNDKNWDLKYGEEKEKYKKANLEFSKYIEKDFPFYNSLENYFKMVVPSVQTIDANGVIAHKPIINYDNDGNEIDVELNEPIPVYYSIKEIVSYKNDEHCMIELSEKSIIEFGGKKRAEGIIYELYDNENIYHIKQIGKKSDYEFIVETYFQHNCGYVPVIKNGGIPITHNCEIHFQSPFIYCVPILDNCAVNATYLSVSINSCVYPHKVMIGNVCTFEHNGNKCMDGVVYDNILQKHVTCPSCNGVGLKDRTSRLGVMLLNPATREDDGDSTFKHDPLKFVSPEIHTLEFLENKISKDMQKARQIMHLHNSNTDVKGSEEMTATGMAIDLKALYAFIQPQVYSLFRKWEFTLNTIGIMRYGDDFKKPVLTYPYNFDFVTEEEMLSQFSNAIKSGLPPIVIRVYLERLLRSMYFNENETAKILDLVIAADPLLPLSNDDILLKQSKGVIENWEVILHDKAITIIRNLYEKDEDFFSKELSEQVDLLEKEAKKKSPKKNNVADEILNG